MVRNGHTVPPVYFLTVPALAVFYLFASAQGVASLAPCVIGASVIACAVLSAAWPLRSRTYGTLLLPLLCAALGVLGGALASSVIHAQNGPLSSLSPRKDADSVSVCFLSDPVPWGPDFFRVACAVESVGTRDGSSFSARGRCALVFPSSMEKESLPGGLAGRSGGSILYSKGLRASFTGRFAPYSRDDGELFYAREVIPSSVRWQGGTDFFRARLRLSLARILYDWGDSGGFLLALFSANRDYLDPALSQEFKRTGLAHVLALSGMHLSLLALVAIRVGKKIGGKRLSIKLSLFAIVFFVWFAGISPSLNRALAMAIFMMVLARLGFRPDILPVLALTAFVQMLLQPSDAGSLAFMLSYGALLGIVTFGEAVLSLVPARFRFFPAGELASSIGAQLMTSPVLAFSVGVIAPIGIAASCVVSPLSSVFLVCGMLLVAVSVAVPPLSILCGSFVDLLYRITVLPVHFFARFPPLSIGSLPATITACAFSLFAGFVFMYLAARFRKRRSVDDCFARL